MSDQSQEAQEEPRPDSDRLDQVRAWGERNEKRAKEAEERIIELRQTIATSAIRAAGAPPDSWTEKVVMAAVERDSISDPDDIAALVRVVQAENRGA